MNIITSKNKNIINYILNKSNRKKLYLNLLKVKMVMLEILLLTKNDKNHSNIILSTKFLSVANRNKNRYLIIKKQILSKKIHKIIIQLKSIVIMLEKILFTKV